MLESQPTMKLSSGIERISESKRGLFDRIRARGVSARVADVMERVPREEFVPGSLRDVAYVDTSLPIGHGQTISQPSLVAFMTEALGIRDSDDVLEVGTGSGYQAAILAGLAKRVHSVELVEPLAVQAADRLLRLGYTNVTVVVGDGYAGWRALRSGLRHGFRALRAAGAR
jgi:protein-L-isoaspartate(D-aspartate) O-methyltransferase